MKDRVWRDRKGSGSWAAEVWKCWRQEEDRGGPRNLYVILTTTTTTTKHNTKGFMWNVHHRVSSTIGILCWVILCWRKGEMSCRTLGSIPDIYTLEASCTSPHCDKQNCLQTLPNAPQRGTRPRTENHGAGVRRPDRGPVTGRPKKVFKKAKSIIQAGDDWTERGLSSSLSHHMAS